MAFTPEDGTGVANANSLTTVAFADAYHADRGNADWTALQLATKQQKLIAATDYLVGKYGSLLAGRPVLAGQALPFPRMVNCVNIGNPVGIQQATAELALIAVSTPLLPTLGRVTKSVKVGPIEVQYDTDGPQEKQFIAASMKLCPFLNGASGAMVKLVRS